jgi:hypothetical protein
MRASVERLGLPIEVTTVRSVSRLRSKQATWVRNCARKPSFLVDRRQALRGPLLYLDVDAVVHRDPWPLLAGFDADIGAYFPHDGWLHGATLALPDTSACLALLREWRDRCDADPTAWDQRVLQTIVESGRWRFQNLPHLLCAKTGEVANPVVEQLNASRDARRKWSFWRWFRPWRWYKLPRKASARHQRIAALDRELGVNRLP